MAGSILGSRTGSPMTTATPTERLVASRPGTRATPAASLWDEGFRRFRRHRLAALGAVVLFAMVVAVVAGPAIYRVPINDIDFKAKLRGPSWAHPLGTDDLGQDLLARMLYGGRISLAVGVTAMIIAESSLSFLGLGFPPDIPTWGCILFDAKDNLDFAPHWAFFPGTAIFLTVLSINYIGDGLRDALDPRKVISR